MRGSSRAALLALAFHSGSIRGQDSAVAAQTRPRLVAVRTDEPIIVDGLLRERAWRKAPATTAFRQVEPRQGSPSRLGTEVRVLFDEHNLYVGVDCRDPVGRHGIRVRDLRRKFDSQGSDKFGVVLDPLHDGRTAIAFEITPYGSQSELQVFDDNLYNTEWEAVWRVRTAISDSGWTAEIAIPWSTLRYRVDGSPWGVNFYRIARRLQETSAWAPWPRVYSAYRLPYAGLLEGLAPPPPAINLRVRPYVLGAVERNGAGAASTTDGRVGGELTWAPTSNAVLDLTANTDFAQADVDRQVINLSRFSVLFPERRQFFLESASLFDVGVTSQGQEFAVAPFFSRRIGLDDDGNAVRIQGGARFVRRDAAGSDAFLLLRQSGQDSIGPSTFAVGRVTRNLGVSGRIGGLVTARVDEPGSTARGMRSVMGALDGFTQLGPSVRLSGMASVTSAANGHGMGEAAFATLTRQSNTLYTSLTEALVTRDYDPSVGFVSRSDVVMTNPTVWVDWRPAWRPSWLRRLRPYLSTNLYESPSTGRLEESFSETFFELLFESDALAYPDLQHFYQRLTAPFEPVRGVVIPAGAYSYFRPELFFGSDPSRRYSASADLLTGGFYDRSLDQATLTLRGSPSPQAAAIINYQVNHFHGQRTTVTTQLLAPEVRLALNPRVQLSAFYQYDSDVQRGAWNVRFSFEFAPLSYAYLVYNDLRAGGTVAGSDPTLPRQQLVLKIVYQRQL